MRYKKRSFRKGRKARRVSKRKRSCCKLPRSPGKVGYRL